jgi:NAD(P)-dependent dehydrogenase (short-subunit alcohol dehydrogenase family)
VTGQRVAVVTGGSSGIGAALARRLADGGWHCVLIARGVARLRATATDTGAEYEPCDVADRAQMDRVAASICERHPAVELLVNCAGVPGRTGFLDADPERIERVLDVNYLGSVWCLRAFLPALERAAPAHVVNVVSVAGSVAFPPSGPYAASKHAQLAFSRATAAELADRGISVHTVSPGFVETEGFPQRSVLTSPLLARTIIEPDRVAKTIMKLIERNHREAFVPRWFRAAAVAQVVAPQVVGKLLARYRTGHRREEDEAG